MFGKSLILYSIPLLAFLAVEEGSPATWYVDGSVSASGDGKSWETAVKTIQEGIGVSLDGDTVIVAKGTYIENIYFSNTSIVLRSTDPLDPDVVASTIIDGNRARAVVAFYGRQNESCRLSGFIIRNGRSDYAGAGIHGGHSNRHTHATIENNVICGNVCAGEEGGGGIAFCDGIIRNNVINSNHVEELEVGAGAGLYDCDGLIENNTISNNIAWRLDTSIMNCTFGGGLYRCDGTIQNNVIVGNRANLGGGLYECTGAIRNNIIAGNVAEGEGGGLEDCDGPIENNAIIGNRAEPGALRVGDGGGLAFCDGVIRSNIIAGNWASYYGGGTYSCTGAIQNCTITGNSAAKGGGGLSGSHREIANCIIWGNTASESPQVYPTVNIVYSCIQDWTGGGEGNISEDPRFADPDGPDDDPGTWGDNDYRLGSDSPCIGAGQNEDWMLQAVDLDGNPRIWGGTVDMGAYEYASFHFKVMELLKPSSGGATLTWRSRPGDSYTVWSRQDLLIGAWKDEATVPSEGDLTTWVDVNAIAAPKFYRIELRQGFR